VRCLVRLYGWRGRETAAVTAWDRLLTRPSKDFFSLTGEDAVEEVLLLLLTSRAWPDWDLGREASDGEAVLFPG